MGDLQTRKASHLDLCATDDVAFSQKTTLFEQVDLVHDALPELDIAAIQLATVFGAGTVYAGTQGTNVRIPSETLLTFTLRQPVTK